MGKHTESLSAADIEFIGRQRMFFVSTAPSGDGGLLSLSPKGLDTFVVMGSNEVAYLDLIGSGIETVAHVRQNGRITLMFCAFEGSPNILRLWGEGDALEPGDGDWDELRGRFPEMPGVRSIIRVKVARVCNACGFAVPRYNYEGDRRTLLEWAEKKGPEGIEAYKDQKNRKSLDGLPGLRNLPSEA